MLAPVAITDTTLAARRVADALDETAVAELCLTRIPYCPHSPTIRQAAYLALNVREAFYGGAAGGGKSDALLMGALQYVHVPGYAALILRRNYQDLTLPGALMTRAEAWLAPTDAQSKDGGRKWVFPSGAVLQFGHLEHARQRFRYQSSEFQYIGFDEVTQFPELVYRYLFTRLRRLKGGSVPLRMRAAANPDGEGLAWVKNRFVDPKTRGRRVFIPAKLKDNPHLDEKSYRESLMELDPVTRKRMLDGDWEASDGGTHFQRHWFKPTPPVRTAPHVTRVRFWDLASTEPSPNKDPDWTVGVLMARRNDVFIVEDVIRKQVRPGEVERMIQATAEMDGPDVTVGVEQEPGAAGKLYVNVIRKLVRGYPFRVRPAIGTKVIRARPWANAVEADEVRIVPGSWNSVFVDEHEEFPGGGHDDQVDAAGGAYWCLTKQQGSAPEAEGEREPRRGGGSVYSGTM